MMLHCSSSEPLSDRVLQPHLSPTTTLTHELVRVYSTDSVYIVVGYYTLIRTCCMYDSIIMFPDFVRYS